MRLSCPTPLSTIFRLYRGGWFNWRGVLDIQHYVIKFVSDLRQVSSFLRIFRFPPTIKVTVDDITEILLKVALNTITIALTKQQCVHMYFLGQQGSKQYILLCNKPLVIYNKIKCSVFSVEYPQEQDMLGINVV